MTKISKKIKAIKPKRTNRLTISLNNEEFTCIDNYCKRYKISNKTKFCRESIIKIILKDMERNSPTLFD